MRGFQIKGRAFPVLEQRFNGPSFGRAFKRVPAVLSGKREALRIPPPLRTVLAPFKAHGSSKSLPLPQKLPDNIRTGRIAAMDLTMAEVMYKAAILQVFSILVLMVQDHVVILKVFSVQEMTIADWAFPLLCAGHFQPCRGKCVCLTVTFFPVTIEAGIIRGCFPAHEGMPFNLRPAELDKVATRLLVAKHPVVFPSLIQASPILVLDPLP
ncbi:hypothetical protein [Deinococcus sp. UYEF24]